MSSNNFEPNSPALTTQVLRFRLSSLIQKEEPPGGGNEQTDEAEGSGARVVLPQASPRHNYRAEREKTPGQDEGARKTVKTAIDHVPKTLQTCN